MLFILRSLVASEVSSAAVISLISYHLYHLPTYYHCTHINSNYNVLLLINLIVSEKNVLYFHFTSYLSPERRGVGTKGRTATAVWRKFHNASGTSHSVF